MDWQENEIERPIVSVGLGFLAPSCESPHNAYVAPEAEAHS